MSEKTSKYFINNSFKFQCTFGKFSGICLALGLLSIHGIDYQNCLVSEPKGLLNPKDKISSTSFYSSIVIKHDGAITRGEEGGMEMSGFVSGVSFPRMSLLTRIDLTNTINKLGAYEAIDL